MSKKFTKLSLLRYLLFDSESHARLAIPTVLKLIKYNIFSNFNKKSFPTGTVISKVSRIISYPRMLLNAKNARYKENSG